jgi:hypothetical protein
MFYPASVFPALLKYRARANPCIVRVDFLPVRSPQPNELHAVASSSQRTLSVLFESSRSASFSILVNATAYFTQDAARN